ncbi:unnamed protein product [Brassica oleracea]
MRGDRTRRLVNRDYIDMSCHSPIYSVRKTQQGRGGQAQQRGRGRGQAQLGHGRQVGGRQAEPVEPQTKIPSFGDGSSIQRDWTTSGLIGDPINQRLLIKRARGHGGTTTGHFEQRQDASRTFVYDTLERTPLGIVINNFPVFEDVGMGIYHVPLALDNVTPEHGLLVLARGITDDGVEFVVAQNSWGTTTFGNQGYCRLFLPADGSFKIFWPHFD